MKLKLNFQKIQFELPGKSEDRAIPAIVSKKQWALFVGIFILFSVAAWGFYFQQGLTLAYNDARSHLNVARRVVDSLQPGVAQIGSVWLPLYHVLEMPFIWQDYLWHSGIAGSVISMISYIVSGVYLVKIGTKLRLGWGALLVTGAIYTLNPNLLFLQTAPMTESLLLCLTLAASYYVLDWAISFRATSLVLCAFFTFLATLTRYDGWFLMAFISLAIALVAYKKKGFRFAEGTIVIYVTLAAFGIFLWFLWNLVIFGDPLYFALGEFSAKSQQDVLLSQGRLFTKGNVLYSTFIYLFAVRYNLGTWLSLLTVAGCWFVTISKKYSRDVKIALSVLLAPLFFNILSLVAGHSVIHLPDLPPYTWFNDRYGLMLLPLAAVVIGIMVNGRKFAIILTLAVIMLQIQVMYVGNRIITIEDGVRGASGEYLDEAGNWIKDNVKEGLVLAAASSNDALLFRSGLPLKQFIVEGAKSYWEASLRDPTVYAQWIVMHKGDLVDRNIRHNPLFLANYRLVYHDNFSYVYKKDMHAAVPISDAQLP